MFKEIFVFYPDVNSRFVPICIIVARCAGYGAKIWETFDDRTHEPQEGHVHSPFSLSGIDEVQPAGTYTVETNEELLPGLSFPAYRRIATVIFLPSRRGVFVERVVNIDPLELEAAQKKDASIA